MSQFSAKLLVQTGDFLLEDINHNKVKLDLPLEFKLSENNPDLFYIREEAGSSISIDAIKKFCSWCEKKPYQNDLKLGVIWPAEKMTPQAQNSLLKTLEEPAENTQILLVSKNPNQLLSTVKSRLVSLRSTPNNLDRLLNTGHADIAERFLRAEYVEKKAIIDKNLAKATRPDLANFIKALLKATIANKEEWAIEIEEGRLAKLEQLLDAILSGVNQKLILENLILI